MSIINGDWANITVELICLAAQENCFIFVWKTIPEHENVPVRRVLDVSSKLQVIEGDPENKSEETKDNRLGGV